MQHTHGELHVLVFHYHGDLDL